MNESISFSPAALQLMGSVLLPVISALVAMFWLLYRSQGERCQRAETQVDKILPALEKLTDLMERSREQRGQG